MVMVVDTKMGTKISLFRKNACFLLFQISASLLLILGLGEMTLFWTPIHSIDRAILRNTSMATFGCLRFYSRAIHNMARVFCCSLV